MIPEEEFIEQLANDFVEEYLEADIEFTDVLEFIDDNYSQEYEEEFGRKVHNRVKATIDTILQRWLDD